MDLKKFVSLLFVMLLGASSFVLAANNTRNVYSVYSDNFNGAHIYGGTVASGDEDGAKIDLWNQGKGLELIPSYSGGVEGKEYISYRIKANVWDVVSYSPYNNSGLAPRNMSAYAGGQIKFWARSSNSSFGTATAGFQYRSGTDVSFKKTLSELNFNANGQWQELTISLPTNNLDNVISMFIFQANTLTVGNSIDIDNIRWIKSDGAASLSVVRKKVSDNTTVSEQTISFSSNTFGQGWVVADQYLELDIDGEFSANNWRINVYSSATEEEKAGLYNATINDKLPMAFKVSCSTLPYTYIDDQDRQNINSLEIGENKNESGNILGLYDAGKVAFLTEHYGQAVGDGAKWWYPWFYIQKKSTVDDNTLALNNIGCHTFENDNVAQFDTLANTYERNPRLFIACDTREAKAVKYEASLIINLSFE